MSVAYVEVPSGWRRVASRGFGPFVTREVFRLPDGSHLLWDSRWHRKHAGRVPGGSTWWAPFALDWWMGVLFAVGSVCFALGSFPLYATAVGATPDDITFFVGSIFFTTASFLQYMEVASSPTDLAAPHRNGLASLLRIRHRRIDCRRGPAVDDHRGPFARQRSRDGVADAGGRAGDQGNFLRQL